MTTDDLREQVRNRYAAAATTVMDGGTNNDAFWPNSPATPR